MLLISHTFLGGFLSVQIYDVGRFLSSAVGNKRNIPPSGDHCRPAIIDRIVGDLRLAGSILVGSRPGLHRGSYHRRYQTSNCVTLEPILARSAVPVTGTSDYIHIAFRAGLGSTPRRPLAFREISGSRYIEWRGSRATRCGPGRCPVCRAPGELPPSPSQAGQPVQRV